MGFGGGAGAWYLSRGGKRDKDSCEVGVQMKVVLHEPAGLVLPRTG